MKNLIALIFAFFLTAPAFGQLAQGPAGPGQPFPFNAPATGYFQTGSQLLNAFGTGSITFAGVTCSSQCDVLGGIKAGGNLPANDYLTTCFGWNACGSTALTRPELVCMGWNACGQGSGANFNFNVGIGINALGNCLLNCNQTVALGIDAGRGANDSEQNVLIGFGTGDHADYTSSIFIGKDAGSWPIVSTSTVTSANIGIGISALQGSSATTATDNIGIGNSSLFALTTAIRNVAIGPAAAQACTTCNSNTMAGWKVANAGTTFTDSSFFGFNVAGGGVLIGDGNNVFGSNAANVLSTGSKINMFGAQNGKAITSGSSNNVFGDSSLQLCQTCLGNTIIGNSSANSMVNGFDNIVLTAATAIDVANGASHTINISNIWTATGTGTAVTSATVIAGTLTVSGITADTAQTDATVCEDTTNHKLFSGTGTLGICLGTSSKRFKNDLGDLDVGLPSIMALQPKQFTMKEGHGEPGKVMYGFYAEDAVSALPKLTGLDADGAPKNFDYLGVVPVLVKAMQEQERQIDAIATRRDKDAADPLTPLRAQIESQQHQITFLVCWCALLTAGFGVVLIRRTRVAR